MDYFLTFLFEEALLCNLSMVQEFYANMKTKACSQVVAVRGIETNISLVAINRILGTMDVSMTPFNY